MRFNAARERLFGCGSFASSSASNFKSTFRSASLAVLQDVLEKNEVL